MQLSLFQYLQCANYRLFSRLRQKVEGLLKISHNFFTKIRIKNN